MHETVHQTNPWRKNTANFAQKCSDDGILTRYPGGMMNIDIADPSRPLALLAYCPVHSATPLRGLSQLATDLGWAALQVKDETARMGAGPKGMGSFKALGGAYAVADILMAALGVALSNWRHWATGLSAVSL